MKITKTKIDGVIIIEPKIFSDERGWFSESYSKTKFDELNFDVNFIQDNHSLSKEKHTLRGLHFQLNPKAQSKLLRCTRGEVLDVAVDLRVGSPTYKEWISVKLSEKNKKQIFIPKGCAHGFLTLTEDAEVQYKVDEYYSPEHDRSLKFDDPEIGVEWECRSPILSEKDRNALYLEESDSNFAIKVLVTGANGQLGYDVVLELKESGFEVLSPSKLDFDITDADNAKAYIIKNRPDIIIHCAAYTNVDKAESDKEKCYEINVVGTQNIVDAAKLINSKVVYISTDYVFDGSGDSPRLEYESMNPINYYGITKYMGEKIVEQEIESHFIVRTSWLYGSNGKNFIETIIRLSKQQDEINVVCDQVGSPTYTKDLATMIAKLIQTKNYGKFHGVNSEYCSWYDLAKFVLKEIGSNSIVNPIKSIDYYTAAKRPMNSRLTKSKYENESFYKMKSWDDAVLRYLTKNHS